MTYVISVGGDPINPNPFTYSQISMTGNITLAWPFNNQSSTYTATNWVDITSSAAYTATMSDAREAGEGQEVVFNNYGAFTVTINDAGGSSITTVASGETKRIWITDNSTEAGTWRVSNIGSGTTEADAIMLAGYGLVAQAGQLSQSMPVSAISTDTTITSGYRSYLVLWTGGSGTLTMDSPASLGSNWFFDVKNAGDGTLTLDGNGANIDESSTADLSPNEGFTVTTDGAAFYSIGRLTPDTSGETLLNKSLGTGGETTLTSQEAAYSIINYTGSLSTNASVVVPSAVNQWTMKNSTSGTPYTTTIKTSGGTGVTIVQGTQRIVYSDGTDVYYSDAVGTGTVTSVDSGTGLTGGPITGTGTLSIANTAVTAGAYGAAGTVATFTVNQQGQLTNSTSVSIAITSSNISGTIPTSKGGTGLAASGTAGNFLQSDGTDWTSATTLGVSNGGTGANTLTANNVILGNGTSAVSFVAPSTAGNILASNGTTWISVTPNVSSPSLASPASTTSTVGVMMGLANLFTPAKTGKIFISFCGYVNVNSSGTATIRIRYGTGSAPANGAALTGTAIGSSVAMGQAGVSVPFSSTYILEGLTLTTQIWIDLSLASSDGNIAVLSSVQASIFEF